MEEKLNLTTEWDKTFPKSDKVNHHKITFHNRYGITLAADLYEPENIACPGSMRSLWGSQRAGIRTVCTDNGRKRIYHHRLRSLFYW